MIQYRTLSSDEISRDLFKDFIRHQVVTKCWRKENAEWVINDDHFIDDWGEKEYEILISCLKHTLATNGFVYAAFWHGMLKGFVSVESGLFGNTQSYLDLSSIHVSEDLRGKGIGASLFHTAKEWAKSQGAAKLYISAHSAVESQAFYKKMGCVDAEFIHQKHAEDEPYDCQLECTL
ncbi:MAG: GNAT family N-acetyltransferase [Lachnospiraceae bacterium]|nr:GNAT family N-acetyltransferase [Lachnospiraceae bacterium]